MSTKRSRYLKKSYREGLDKANAKVAAQETEGTLESGCPACGSTEVSWRVSNDLAYRGWGNLPHRVFGGFETGKLIRDAPKGSQGKKYQCRCRHCGIDYFTN